MFRSNVTSVVDALLPLLLMVLLLVVDGLARGSNGSLQSYGSHIDAFHS